MMITTIAFYLVVRRLWQWPAWFAAPLCGLFLVVDLAFFGANLHKVHEGGWFTIAIFMGAGSSQAIFGIASAIRVEQQQYSCLTATVAGYFRAG